MVAKLAQRLRTWRRCLSGPRHVQLEAVENISKAFLTLACHSMSFILDGRPAPRARHFFKDLLRISHAAGKREVDQGLFLHYLGDFARSGVTAATASVAPQCPSCLTLRRDIAQAAQLFRTVACQANTAVHGPCHRLVVVLPLLPHVAQLFHKRSAMALPVQRSTKVFSDPWELLLHAC